MIDRGAPRFNRHPPPPTESVPVLPPQAFTLCHEWVDRWLPGDPQLHQSGADAPDPLASFDPVRWAFAWTDCAVREIVPLALESLDLPGQAAALRRIAPLVTEAAGLEAKGRLVLAAQTAAAMGPKYHFCSSARLAVDESLVLFRASEGGPETLSEQLWRVQGLFSESGALDMVIHRAISAGAPRDEVRERLRARLAQLLSEPPRAAGEIDAPDTEETSAPVAAPEVAPPPFSWMAPVAGATARLQRSG